LLGHLPSATHPVTSVHAVAPLLSRHAAAGPLDVAMLPSKGWIGEQYDEQNGYCSVARSTPPCCPRCVVDVQGALGRRQTTLHVCDAMVPRCLVAELSLTVLRTPISPFEIDMPPRLYTVSTILTSSNSAPYLHQTLRISKLECKPTITLLTFSDQRVGLLVAVTLLLSRKTRSSGDLGK
jgi:hypothetical protein